MATLAATAAISSAIAAGASTAATIMQITGTMRAANAAKAAGIAQQNEANYEAAQLRQNADQQQAAAEQKMIADNKKTDLVLSNARVEAAAGGGSATDPTVVTNMQTIAGEGKYRALTDMYQGNAAAQSLNNQATAKEYSGNIAADAGRTKATSTILSGASSLFNKYANISTPGSPSGASGTMDQDEFDEGMASMGAP